MKKYTIPQLVSLLGVPVLTVVLGLVLLFSPDTASALVGKILGWVFLLAAISDGFSARSGGKKYLLRAVILGLIGLWVLMNPLSMAKTLGRILGLAFFIWGTGSVRRNYRNRVTPGLLAAGAVAILGLILFLLPLSVTRTVLNIVGIVIICIGIADGFDRIRGRKLLEGGDDPNIIDVEKL